MTYQFVNYLFREIIPDLIKDLILDLIKDLIKDLNINKQIYDANYL